MTAAYVALGGAAGAVLRYAVGVAVGPRSWPWPTLAINVGGSFLLGLLLTIGLHRWPAAVTTAVTVGALGAFTTFSTFSFETLTLLDQGRVPAAVSYIVLSVVLGVLAAFGGRELARAVLPERDCASTTTPAGSQEGRR